MSTPTVPVQDTTAAHVPSRNGGVIPRPRITPRLALAAGVAAFAVVLTTGIVVSATSGVSARDMISWAYAFVPVVVIVGWLPQIVTLIRNPASAHGMSVGTWAIWTVSGAVGTIYGIVVLSDVLVTLTFAANFAGQVTILGFALWAKIAEPA